MSKDNITYWVGGEEIEKAPIPVYSEIVCDFLNDLSKTLRKDTQAKQYNDILTFAFWCRKGNIAKLRDQYQSKGIRVGRGVVFHIAPSNVPINFAYSLAFGMLAGNGNIVRVSEKGREQVGILCRAMSDILKHDKYKIIKKQTQIISYAHNKVINDKYSRYCDARVIWGGDGTIEELRKSPINARCVEITFADRYSFGIFNESEMEGLSDSELRKLTEKFYNDTYLMDQNACSSPHLIFWLKQKGATSKEGRRRFWQSLFETSKKYELPEKKVMDKFTLLCERAVEIEEVGTVQKYDNRLYVVRLDGVPNNMEVIRGEFGMFFEADLDKPEDIASIITKKVQTCVSFGVKKEILVDMLINGHLMGIDRIVPIGEAMDIGVYWDGYDVIGSLSRVITIGD